ncbi:hypothetical protein GCM10029992_54180 [Glycomyces albus]
MSRRSPLHRRLGRRTVLAAPSALGGVAFLSACGGGEAASDSSGGTWSFTDDRDQTVELDSTPTSVVAFTGLAAAMYDFGVEIKTVFGPTTLADGEPDLQAGRMPVEGLEVIGNTWGEFDMERFAASEPEILISHYHEGFPLWYVPEESVDQVEELVPTLGIAAADQPSTTPSPATPNWRRRSGPTWTPKPPKRGSSDTRRRSRPSASRRPRPR